jgi:hypothetical protein
VGFVGLRYWTFMHNSFAAHAIVAAFTPPRCPSTLRIRLFHIADDGLPTIVHMDVLDADKLPPAVGQASKNST